MLQVPLPVPTFEPGWVGISMRVSLLPLFGGGEERLNFLFWPRGSLRLMLDFC